MYDYERQKILCTRLWLLCLVVIIHVHNAHIKEHDTDVTTGLWSKQRLSIMVIVLKVAEY